MNSNANSIKKYNLKWKTWFVQYQAKRREEKSPSIYQKRRKEYMTLQIIVDCTTNRFQLVHVYK